MRTKVRIAYDNKGQTILTNLSSERGNLLTEASIRRYLTRKYGRVTRLSVAPASGKAFTWEGWIHSDHGDDRLEGGVVVAVGKTEAKTKVRKFLRCSVVADDFKLTEMRKGNTRHE